MKDEEQYEPLVDHSNVVSMQTAENIDEDMEELLELANAKKSNVYVESKPKMLQLSKLVELIDEGRVLVRSAVPHSPTHNIKDFPFDTFTHEALRSLGFDKPKIIQAYVWEAILRGHHVSYVAGARGGKTLGILFYYLYFFIRSSNPYFELITFSFL